MDDKFSLPIVEANYHRLMELVPVLLQPGGCKHYAIARNHTAEFSIVVSQRDPDQRASRVFLLGLETLADGKVRPLTANVQLIHRCKMAVVLVFQEGSDRKQAFDENGRLLTTKLLELGNQLGSRLQRQSRFELQAPRVC